MEETQCCDLDQGDYRQARVEPALHPRQPDGVLQMPLEEFHGNTLPASFRTGSGYIPNNKLASAVTTKGMTIQGTSRT